MSNIDKSSNCIMVTDTIGDLMFWALKVVIAVEITFLIVLLTLGVIALGIRYEMPRRIPLQQKDPEKGMAGNVVAGE